MLHRTASWNALQILRRFGGQVAMSVSVSLAAAAVLALPSMMGPDPKQRAAVASASQDEPVWWQSPVAADGKIRDRLQQDGRTSPFSRIVWDQPLARPASAIMPMTLEWQQASPAIAAVSAAPSDSPALRAARSARIVKPEPEGVRLAASTSPMLITPFAGVSAAPSMDAAQSAAVSSAPSILGVAVPSPVIKAGQIVSSAAGAIGGAGSWTVSKATDLLPPWAR